MAVYSRKPKGGIECVVKRMNIVEQEFVGMTQAVEIIKREFSHNCKHNQVFDYARKCGYLQQSFGSNKRDKHELTQENSVWQLNRNLIHDNTRGNSNEF